MTFTLKILGSNSAAPAYNRHQTAQVLTAGNEHFLIDCGEGTQTQMNKYRVKANKIKRIFISHLHGDHFYGLIGLISTMHLKNRQDDLTVYGPRPLAGWITETLKLSQTVLRFKLHFIPLNMESPEPVWENKRIAISSFPVYHSMPSVGFRFMEKEKPIRLNKERLPQNLSLKDIADLKKGAPIRHPETGKLIENHELTLPPKKSRMYAYTADTAYNENLIPFIEHADLLYHEATFTKDNQDRAEHTLHSTAEQAAMLAKKANVDQLLIGHFSIRYKDLQPVLEEAKAVFPHTELALEGRTFDIQD